MENSIWNGIDIHDVFCLDCDSMMNYEGYEKGDDLGKVIQSETKEGLEMVFLNFKCPDCKKRTSVMLQ